MKQLAFKRNLQVTRKTKVFSAFPNLSPAAMLSVRENSSVVRTFQYKKASKNYTFQYKAKGADVFIQTPAPFIINV